jgi:glycosyltransferase involved in cell wall biosynthesis
MSNKIPSESKQKEIHWFIPHISHVDYGGAKTIFRLADYLQRKSGYHSTFVVVTEQPVDELQEKVGVGFPSLSSADFYTTQTYNGGIERPADLYFATYWITAYFIEKWAPREKWFYLVQDHEPDFYPAGSLNSLAKETYRMGFQVIANTKGLFSFINQKYGCEGTYFTPQIDHHIFYPAKEKTRRNWKRIVFYARPNHPRNGFEIAAEALKMVKKKLGYRVEIFCVGDELDLAMFGLERIVTNLGLLTYAETAALYRQCDIGLTLMMTKHPSYLPLEFMASGLLLVTNDNPVHSGLLQHGQNCLLAPATPGALAEQLFTAVLDFENFDHISRQAIIDVSHLNDWDEAFELVRALLESKMMIKPDVFQAK